MRPGYTKYFVQHRYKYIYIVRSRTQQTAVKRAVLGPEGHFGHFIFLAGGTSLQQQMIQLIVAAHDRYCCCKNMVSTSAGRYYLIVFVHCWCVSGCCWHVHHEKGSGGAGVRKSVPLLHRCTLQDVYILVRSTRTALSTW